MQYAVRSRLNSGRLRLAASQAYVDIHYGDVRPNEAKLYRCQCERSSLKDSSKDLLMSAVKLFSANMKSPIDISKGAIGSITRTICFLYRTRFFGHKFELSGLLHSGFLPGDTCVVRTA